MVGFCERAYCRTDDLISGDLPDLRDCRRRVDVWTFHAHGRPDSHTIRKFVFSYLD